MSGPIATNNASSRVNAPFIWPGVVYFGWVFAVGFLFGTVRILAAVPVVGERAAELGEIPLMLAAVVFIARRLVRRFRIPRGRARIYVGATGLVLLIAAELMVVLLVRAESLQQYVSGRDPVAGTIYLFALGLFALMPWLLGLRPASAAPGRAAQ